MAVVTPGDILARCRALDARIKATSDRIDASASSLGSTFVTAWRERLRRWAEIRSQCAEWASRNFNWKWGPILDDWAENQTWWERTVEQRTGAPIPAPEPSRQDEEPSIPTGTKGVGAGVILGGLAVSLAAIALLSRRRTPSPHGF